jgi:glycosyltransferase EpsF
MLAGVKKRIAHHHQAYQKKNVMLSLLCAALRIPCKLFATDWLACGKAAANNGWGLRAVRNGQVTILPNAIDPEVFKFNEIARQKIRSQYGIRDDDLVIGHVGRFFPQKNHDFLIDVFFEVFKQEPRTKLLLLGEGPLQEKIQQKVDLLGINRSVLFAGIQKNPAPYYNAMDIFCFPSLYEGLPLTLVEAEYNGLPCVVSDHVTKEVSVTTNISYLPLELSAWAKKTIEFMQSALARGAVVKDNLFDIKLQINKLNQLYGN